jgi:hypothetical protein
MHQQSRAAKDFHRRDAEAQRNQFASAPGGVGTLQEVAQKGDLAADEHG